MTRRNFFRSALACFGAMVLSPVRAVADDRVPLIGNWEGKVRHWRRLYFVDGKVYRYVELRPEDFRGMFEMLSGNLELLGGRPPV